MKQPKLPQRMIDHPGFVKQRERKIKMEPPLILARKPIIPTKPKRK